MKMHPTPPPTRLLGLDGGHKTRTPRLSEPNPSLEHRNWKELFNTGIGNTLCSLPSARYLVVGTWINPTAQSVEKLEGPPLCSQSIHSMVCSLQRLHPPVLCSRLPGGYQSFMGFLSWVFRALHLPFGSSYPFHEPPPPHSVV